MNAEEAKQLQVVIHAVLSKELNTDVIKSDMIVNGEAVVERIYYIQCKRVTALHTLRRNRREAMQSFLGIPQSQNKYEVIAVNIKNILDEGGS